MQETTYVYIFLAVAALIVFMSSTGISKPSEAYQTAYIRPGANKYTTKCGSCLPTNDDPMTFTQQCVTYNSDGYPLDQYTEANICAKCQQLPNRVISCQSFAPKSGKYMGTVNTQKRCKSCLG